MKEHCKDNLNELSLLLENLTQEEFTRPCEFLSGATIGQHIRHILELYDCLLRDSSEGKVCYDSRKRNILLETKISFALKKIDKILEELKILEDKPMVLEGSYSSKNEINLVKTSLFRELAYNLEHSIHHQALIKVGMRELGKLNLICVNFGVAPATIKFKNG
jgi:uncharacterized damage-inducible protein DinB